MKVVQCWDDGVVNDARLVELLRHYGAKATFNLNIGLMNIERLTSGWLRLCPEVSGGSVREALPRLRVALRTLHRRHLQAPPRGGLRLWPHDQELR